MVSVHIETHGCKLNTADSQQIAAQLLRAGFTLWNKNLQTPDVFILNSCTVTHVADKKARQAIANARRRYPNTLTVLTGCYPERSEEETSALTTVDLVIGNRDKEHIASKISERLVVALTPCADGGAYVAKASLMGRTRASVKIQEGCDQVCAYCIVPKVRGRERNIPAQQIVSTVQNLQRSGCQEVVFTGTQLGHYGFDLTDTPAMNLAEMLRQVLIQTDIPRIRVSSLQPPEIDDDLLSIWNNEGVNRLCPHFHMPLQSGSDSILRQMRRTYSSKDFLRKIDLVKSKVPKCGVTTDIIAGFPGETSNDHAATLAVMESASFSDVHVFPYSPRPGTSAYLYDKQITPKVRAERARELREIAEQMATSFKISQLGSIRPVLWEGKPRTSGLTDNYLKVKLPQPGENSIGENQIENVKLASIANDGFLIGTLA